jgi:uncharacterized iron-regulated membrane protein
MKKLATKLHLILGLASGLIVLIVSLTGALYVFEQEWRELTQAKYFCVERQNGVEIPLSKVQQIVAKNYPKEKITNIRLEKSDSERKVSTILVATKSKLSLSLNPYSGEIIGVRNMNTDMMSAAVQIHTNLLLGDVGEEIIKWNVLIFFIMVSTGLWLWMPPNIKMLKWVIRFKKNQKPFQRNYDLHRILGFYASFVLLAISLTGIWWVFESVQHFVYDVTKSPKTLLEKVKQPKSPPQYSSDFSVEKAFDLVNQDPDNVGWTQAFIQPPKDSTTPLVILFRFPYGMVRKQNRISFDQFTGAILRADMYKNYSVADKIRVSNFDWHTGRIGGFFTKILYFVAALFAASLPITGFLIWWGRRKKTKREAAKKQEIKPKTQVEIPFFQPIFFKK